MARNSQRVFLPLLLNMRHTFVFSQRYIHVDTKYCKECLPMLLAKITYGAMIIGYLT